MARKPTKEVKATSATTRQVARQKAEPVPATKRRTKAAPEESVTKPRAKRAVAATKSAPKTTVKAAPKKVVAAAPAKPARKTAAKTAMPKAVAKTPRAAKSVTKPAGRKLEVVTKLSAVEKLRITQETRKQKRLDRLAAEKESAATKRPATRARATAGRKPRRA